MESDDGNAFSRVLVELLRGVVYREDDPNRWQRLLDLRSQVRDYFATIGLELILDEPEGYSFLRQQPVPPSDEPAIPRLVARRPLTYRVSLLLVLLRKRFLELDTSGGETRLILSLDDMVDIVKTFLPSSANEARLLENVERDLKKILEMGLLRKLQGQEDRYEVMRLIKAFVDAQWIGELDRRLTEYRDHAIAAEDEGESGP